MRRFAKSTLPALFLATVALFAAVAPASASFGLDRFDVTFTDQGGAPVAQAGAHPFAMTTTLHFNSTPTGEGGEVLDEAVRDVLVDQVPGFIGSPDAVPQCEAVDFLANGTAGNAGCPAPSAIGYIGVQLSSREESGFVYGAVFNLAPAPGTAARIGFKVNGVPVSIDLGIDESPPYGVTGGPRGISQLLEVVGAQLVIWGVPADPRHDPLRGGECLGFAQPLHSEGTCPANTTERPFLTVPRACRGPQETSWLADSWGSPGARLPNGRPDVADPAWLRGSALTHDDAEPPAPLGFLGCSNLGFAPEIGAKPTSRAAASPTGLDFTLETDNEGLTNPDGFADADIAKTVVTLPRGMTANPSLAEGLEVCSEAEVGRETSYSEPGDGCPQASKIGTIEVETPLLEGEVLKGSLYQAEPYENPFGTLIALYVVIKDAELGISIVQPLKVEPDPKTGQLVSTAEEMPELPFSEFRLHFREGGRSPLISPPSCDGDPSRPGNQPHTVEALLYPSSGGAPVESTSEFQIVSGPGEGLCPPQTATFSPGFEAGTINNAAGSHSPFYMRLTRKDAEQDLAKFSAVLPPGVLGSVAGIPWCGEPAIAKARARTGAHGAAEELADPSCPAASQIGRSVAGAGVGSQLTYVGGSLYLAGPYNGAPLSVVSVTPAKAGPFDAGVVLVRVGLTLNPITARVEVDGAASDPIPHILKGIPLNVRDLRIYTDRPAFTLNATSCEESQTLATLWGAGTALAPAAETPVGLAARYQAADCAALGFSPRLAIKLKGGVQRGAHPALKAVVTPRPGQANFSRAVVTLPRSAFLDQAHIRTICTRVQFASGPGNGANCPKGAQYGYARAWSPLLDAPAQGPVYLRSSDNKLPDLVAALKGPASAPFDVELNARVDSVRGGIRSTFPAIPDVPVSRFALSMQGGKKGLIVNSRHLCHKPGRNRAISNLRGQNGRFSKTRPRVVALTCAKRRKAKRSRAKRSAGHVSRAAAAG